MQRSKPYIPGCRARLWVPKTFRDQTPPPRDVVRSGKVLLPLGDLDRPIAEPFVQ
jgi:hypothetical protein